MKLIKLANGENLEMNVNFLTLKIIMEAKLFEKEISDCPSEQIKIAGKLIYAVLYSNGKKISEDEALTLIPLGEEETIFDLIDEFQKKVEQFKKKAETRLNLEKMMK